MTRTGLAAFVEGLLKNARDTYAATVREEALERTELVPSSSVPCAEMDVLHLVAVQIEKLNSLD